MTDFLSSTALMSDLDDFEEGDGAVTLMTLHAAKGLSFLLSFSWYGGRYFSFVTGYDG